MRHQPACKYRLPQPNAKTFFLTPPVAVMFFFRVLIYNSDRIAYHSFIMGNSQSGAPRTGGANLPPELLNMVGEYADGDTVSRIRRTGRDGLAVTPIIPSATARRTWEEPWTMYHYDNVVDELWANDNRNTRYVYVKMLEKDGDSCVAFMMHII